MFPILVQAPVRPISTVPGYCSGSFSRSAVNHESGAKTGLAGIVNGIIMGCCLLFMTPLFEYIPLVWSKEIGYMNFLILCCWVVHLRIPMEPLRIYLFSFSFEILIIHCDSIILQCSLAAIVISAVMGLVSISVSISGFHSGSTFGSYCYL